MTGAAVVPWSGKACNKYLFVPKRTKGHLFIFWDLHFLAVLDFIPSILQIRNCSQNLTFSEQDKCQVLACRKRFPKISLCPLKCSLLTRLAKAIASEPTLLPVHQHGNFSFCCSVIYFGEKKSSIWSLIIVQISQLDINYIFTFLFTIASINAT